MEKHWLDVYLNKYQWYREFRGGIWFKHRFTKDAEGITFSEGGTWWARYGKINRYSDVVDSEDYRKIDMIKFYFEHRNIGLDPDTNKYYFSTMEELINQVETLNNIANNKYHFKWSVSKMINDNQYSLMSEYWTTEKRGTETPLKCKGWWVCGYIYTDETNNDLYQILPEWKADYTNHFIERRYMSPDDFGGLSELDKDKCKKDGGIILNRKSFDDAEM